MCEGEQERNSEKSVPGIFTKEGHCRLDFCSEFESMSEGERASETRREKEKAREREREGVSVFACALDPRYE